MKRVDKTPPIGFLCGVSSHNVSFCQYGRCLVALLALLFTDFSFSKMSAVLLLKRSLGRLPSCVARPGLAGWYHTEKGVYGYRPKKSDSPQRLVMAPHQGQYRAKSPPNIPSKLSNQQEICLKDGVIAPWFVALLVIYLGSLGKHKFVCFYCGESAEMDGS